jgi:hypothetical protein
MAALTVVGSGASAVHFALSALAPAPFTSLSRPSSADTVW